jgi:hypothetical protein
MISGTSFDPTPSNNTVKFNGTSATVTSATATSLVVTVPAGATTGPVSVTVSGQTAISSTGFTLVLIQFTTPSFPQRIVNGQSITASISVNYPTQASNPLLFTYGLSTGMASAVSQSSPNLSGEITTNDPIGVGYYFQVTDLSSGAAVSSSVGEAYVTYTTSTMPNPVFGSTQDKYQIFASPLNYTDNSVASVFSSLGPYDNTKWRLFTYDTGTGNLEYPGFNQIVSGKGYWLIVRNPVTIQTGAGSTVLTDEQNPFTINLVQGWNLIGNPYNFKIAWSDVMNFNQNPSGVGSLKTFVNGALAVGNILNAWQGGFVYAQSPTSIKVSTLKNSSLRVAAGSTIGTDTSDDWQIPISLRANGLTNSIGGIGMSATGSLTELTPGDEVVMNFPDGISIPQLTFAERKNGLTLSKYIAPNNTHYVWQFTTNEKQLEIFWNASAIQNNVQKLVLVDLDNAVRVDMLEQSYYKTSSAGRFKIYFGNQQFIEQSLENILPTFGDPYPNPAKNEIIVPVQVSKLQNPSATFSLYDMSGSLVQSWNDHFLTSDRVAVLPLGVSPGVYILKAQSDAGEVRVFKIVHLD